nr:hypothetical protein [Phascolarctobacterium sp.]
MTVSKNPTSLKLSMDVENGTNALGAMQTKAPLSAVSAWTPKPPNASQLPKPSANL